MNFQLQVPPNCIAPKAGTLAGVYWSALDISYTDAQYFRWDSVPCRNQVCSVGPCSAHCWYYSHIPTLTGSHNLHRRRKSKIHFWGTPFGEANQVLPEDNWIQALLISNFMKKSEQHLTYSLHLLLLKLPLVQKFISFTLHQSPVLTI